MKLDLFDDTPSSLRRLVLIIYAIGLPSLSLAVAMELGQSQLPMFALMMGISLLALLWVIIRRQPGSLDWVYPIGIAPVLACGLAAWELGDKGLVFIAVTTTPLVWAAVLFSRPVVIAALASSTLVCLVLNWRSTDPAHAFVATGIFFILQSMVAWVIQGRSNYRVARLASLERSINDIELTLNANGDIVGANDRAVAAYGYSERELTGMNIRQLRAPEWREGIDSHLNQVLAEDHLVFETIHVRKDGSSFPVEASARHFRYQNQVFIENLVRDISGRKQIEDELRQSQEQLNLAITGSGIALWDWQVQNGALTLNDQWAAMIGYTLEELAPISIKTWTDLVHPEDLEISNQLLEMHFSHQSPEYVCELRIRHKAGYWIWIQDRGKVAEWTADGLAHRMIGTHQDITARKEIEMQMSAMLKEVLAQDSLKERLFTILAHDMRGPIGNLNSLLGLAASGTFTPEELQDILVNLKSSAESAYSLLDNILQWVRSSMQEITVLKERIAVDELAAAVCVWLEPSARSKSIQLANETSPHLSVMADKGMCETILRNLVSNALKFSPPGAAVQIRTSYRQDTQEIRIMVEDKGIGIPPETLERINRRELGNQSKGTAGESGSGLGLMFCKDLADRMGSWLEVESSPGQGSTFSLVFPDIIDGELTLDALEELDLNLDQD